MWPPNLSALRFRSDSPSKWDETNAKVRVFLLKGGVRRQRGLLATYKICREMLFLVSDDEPERRRRLSTMKVVGRSGRLDILGGELTMTANRQGAMP